MSEVANKSFTWPIEAGHIHTFAAAIGDLAPEYQVSAGATVAPPTFLACAAHFDPDYPLRPKIGQPWFGSGAAATGAPRSSERDDGWGPILHAEQHYDLQRPIVAGDVLTATTRPGETWEKEGRAGQLRFSERITEFRDSSNEIVAVAKAVIVRTRSQP
jgi:hypothetical protein